jgi:hypothetical protein
MSAPMKKALQLYAFGYGVVSTTVLLVWFVAACQGYGAPGHAVYMTGFALHATAALLTVYRGPTLDSWRWEPLIRPTEDRRIAARFAIGASVALFCVILILSLLLNLRGHTDLRDTMSLLGLISVLLVQSVYLVVHWGLRPENVFSETFIRFASNPLVELFVRLRKR